MIGTQSQNGLSITSIWFDEAETISEDDMKNLDKYRKYEAIVDKITSDFCQSRFPDGFPEYIYRIGTNFKEHKYGAYVQKAEVKEVYYSVNKPYFNKRPSNKNVEDIKNLSETLDPANMDYSNIFLHVNDGSMSWAEKYSALLDGSVSADKKAMEEVLEKKNQHYIDNYLVKEGQFACAYCRKATDNDKKITRDVIARQYPNFRKSFDYCSTKCASYNQMAHEG